MPGITFPGNEVLPRAQFERLPMAAVALALGNCGVFRSYHGLRGEV